jgi:hypothetical protein
MGMSARLSWRETGGFRRIAEPDRRGGPEMTDRRKRVASFVASNAVLLRPRNVHRDPSDLRRAPGHR